MSSMFESLRYHVLKAWSLGLTGDDAAYYVSRKAGVTLKIAKDAIQKLSIEMSQ